GRGGWRAPKPLCASVVTAPLRPLWSRRRPSHWPSASMWDPRRCCCSRSSSSTASPFPPTRAHRPPDRPQVPRRPYRGATLALHSTVGFGLSALGGWGAGVALDAAGGPGQPAGWSALFALLAAGVLLGPIALRWSRQGHVIAS